MSQLFIELCIKRNRVQRHMYIYRRRKLRAHPTHAFAGRAFALRGLSLNHKDTFTSGSGQMISDAGTDNSSANDDDISRTQELTPLEEPSIVVHAPRRNAHSCIA